MIQNVSKAVKTLKEGYGRWNTRLRIENEWMLLNRSQLRGLEIATTRGGEGQRVGSCLMFVHTIERDVMKYYNMIQ
jgi:hypothetical protein